MKFFLIHMKIVIMAIITIGIIFYTPLLMKANTISGGLSMIFIAYPLISLCLGMISYLVIKKIFIQSIISLTSFLLWFFLARMDNYELLILIIGYGSMSFIGSLIIYGIMRLYNKNEALDLEQHQRKYL